MKAIGLLVLVAIVSTTGCCYDKWAAREEARRARADFRRSRIEAKQELWRARQDFRRNLMRAREDFRREMEDARRELRTELRGF